MEASNKSGATSMSGLPNEKVGELRRVIHSHLQEQNIYSQIRDIITSYSDENDNFNPNNPDEVMSVVRERGVVTDILAKMGHKGTAASSSVSSPGLLLKRREPGKSYIHCRLLGGRAFLDNMDVDSAVLRRQRMALCLQFGTQRFRSSLQECSCEPAFDDDFLLKLELGQSSEDGGDPLALNSPLMVTVVREDNYVNGRGTRTSVIGENTVEWRKVLRTGCLAVTVELSGATPGVPVGIVELQLEVIPALRQRSEEEITTRLQAERNDIAAADREFLIYARRWWNEYHAIRPSHGTRHVKVFVQAGGQRMVPVNHFVSPIQADRMLETPQQAARFVSLIEVQQGEDQTQEILTGAKSGAGKDAWLPPFNFLCSLRGDTPNHAALLCSLLLGFGLDAYCAIGSDTNGKVEMWVVTRRRVGPVDYEVLFWDPVAGIHMGQTAGHRYRTIGCVFNHASYYANAADNDSAAAASFDLENELKWKPLNPMKLRLVRKTPLPSLLHIPLDLGAIEADIESSLKQLVSEQRDAQGHRTMWDSSLAYMLSPALAAFELQKTHNGNAAAASMDLELFQVSVKSYLGDGRTFKALPINFTHTNSKQMVTQASANATGREILELVADELHYAVRAKVILFPEGVVSVWVMFAARYRVPCA